MNTGLIILVLFAGAFIVLAGTGLGTGTGDINLVEHDCGDFTDIPVENQDCLLATYSNGIPCYECVPHVEPDEPVEPEVPTEPELRLYEIRANLAGAAGSLYNCGDFNQDFELSSGKWRVSLPETNSCKVYWSTTCQYGSLAGWFEGEVFVSEHVLNAYCGMSVIPILSDSNILR